MAPLHIAVLKSFQVTLAGKPVTGFRSAKTQALLAYLAVEAERPHSREALAGLLWPDAPERVAHHNLSQALLNLRHAIRDQEAHPPFLLITRQSIQFNPPSDLWLDVAALRTHLANCEAHAHAGLERCPSCLEQLRQAIELYRGPFLAEFVAVDSDLFEEWALLKREWLAHRVLEAIERLAEAYERRQEYTQAQRVARRLVELDPLREAAHRRLIRVLALDGQRSAALGQYRACRKLLADELGVDPAAETTALYQQIQAGDVDSAPAAPPRCQDWGEAPELGSFYGRTAELATLEQWLVADRCRVVAVLGMGGVGKTALAARLAEQLAEHFDCVIWRSVLNAPPLADLLRGWLQALAAQQLTTLPTSLDERLGLLLDYLRQRRCLLVLDNLESLLQGGDRAGAFRPGYADYGQLLLRLGQSRHQSCLLLTSRERLVELARLDGPAGPVRSLQLPGLATKAGRAILKERGLGGAADDKAAVVERYSGNPLALKLVAQTIQELFAGDITAFLRDETPIFDDIRDVLDEQLARLSVLERELLLWLAIEREAVSVQTLQNNLVRPEAPRAVLEALRSLQRRSLLEQRGEGFTLQNVVTEYTTDRLIAQVCAELESERLEWFGRHALLKAQAKEYVRQSQARMILQPIARSLVARWGQAGVEQKLRGLLRSLQAEAPRSRGYAAGNILNLLLHLECDLQGYDFSGLSVWQAYLRGMRLPAVNFAHADLAGSVFTDTFRSVNAVAFSPDRQLLAAVGGDGALRLWQVADGQLAAICSGHTTFVWSVAFSPDGRLLASGGADHTIRLWDTRSGQVMHTLRGHTDWVGAVTFSPDGMTLASGSGDQTARLWDVHSGKACRILHGHSAPVRAVAFSPDGATLASGSWDRTVRLWDVRTGQTHHVLQGHTERVRSVAFSPDGTSLASGSADQTVRLWDVRSGKVIHMLHSHTAAVMCVAFSPDGATLASSSDDQTVRVWDARSAQIIHTLHGHTQGVNCVAFSPDGAILASGSGDQTVRLWDSRTGYALYALHGYTCAVYAVAFSPDGATLASGSHDQMVRVLDARTGKSIHTLQGHTRWVMSVAFSPDGTTLASGSHDRTVRLWDVRTGQARRILHGHSNAVESVAFSPDGTMLVSGGHDHTVRLWDAHTGHTLHTLHGHASNIKSVAFSPDGGLLASSSRDQTVRVWDVGTGQVIHVLHGHTSVVESVTFSPEGTILASGSWDGMVRLWDARSGQLIRILQGHTTAVYSVAFSPDGQFLASASSDQTVRLWDAHSGQLIHTLYGHTSWVRPVAFSPDGTMVASGSYDETIKFWDVRTGSCLRTFESDGPYAGVNITGVTGLTEAQKVALKELGAVEDGEEARVAGKGPHPAQIEPAPY